MQWNSTLYDQKHDFVAKYGEGLLTFLPENPAQAILDLGCGTGTLTAQLAARGSRVVALCAGEKDGDAPILLALALILAGIVVSAAAG